ncbi:hypothetical protein [Agromyces bauzanensis]|uniref:Uncharacterized protein n=1 Tax=Agromyces bauzanensis TaxID=1308924 RepID=A0A917PV32_9MICO|nr:hypothetical protein [Agromyces bauzanensis]GGJ92915.1 hypothetical protein GCM10011372_34290 [Agromyces bauzanensis]
MRNTTRRRQHGHAAGHAVAASVAPARAARRLAPLAAALAVLSLGLTLALAPQPVGLTASSAAGETHAGDTQTLSVAPDVAAPAVSQESYTATTGAQTLIASGTNADWAKLVLIYGDWPLTDENVTVMLQWMREENGPDNWWNRNNPLNNGHGSGGGSGLGSYDSLDTAARYAADNLLKRSFYAAIVAALEDGTSAHAVAQAIWASPWASSHYGNGADWTTSPVPIIEAPASAW